MKQTRGSTDQILHYPTSTCLHGSWLKAARGGWVLLTLLLLVIAIASQPASLTALHQPCMAETADCNGQGLLTASQIQALHEFGLDLSTYAWSRIVTTGFSALLSFVMGGLLFWRRSDDWMVLLVALLFASLGAAIATNALQFGSSWWTTLENAVFLIQSLAILFTLALFPNGRFVPRWTLWIVLAYPASVICYLVLLFQLHLPGWTLFNNPVNAAFWFGCWAILTLAQLYRYFRVSTPVERQQTKWVAFTFFLVLVVGIVGYVRTPALLALLHNGFLYLLTANLSSFVFLLLPLSIALAILRYRLWDIDIIINRTLVYGGLTTIIIGMYIFVVGYLGALFRTNTNLLISLVATGLVAVLFQPLRLRLQQGVNHLMYGERDHPYQVISRLGQRLETTLIPEAVLPLIVETVAQALKLPYVTITLQQGDAVIMTAAYGKPVETTLTLPLVYQTETIGHLLLAPRARGDVFTPADHHLLGDLARQAGIAAHAVQLTTELRRARERLVTAREEERRRLRRDLHDGLGPTLAALNLQAGVVRTLIPQDPEQASTLVAEWRCTLHAVIADIRRLVYELRPPALDELGLIGAIREQAAQYSRHAGTHGLPITVEVPDRLPTLPAAVEVAAYRIAQEALANVARHAQARTCQVRLWIDDALHLEITDDGIGLLPEHRVGVGLLSMRERAEELGGSCTIEQASTLGTCVCVQLPFPKE